MGHTPYIPDNQNSTGSIEQAGHAAGIEQSRVPAGPGIRDTARGGSCAGADVSTAPLQALAAGLTGGISPQHFMDSINAGNEQLGNRAFVR